VQASRRVQAWNPASQPIAVVEAPFRQPFWRGGDVSRPPEYPGRRRVKRAVGSIAGDAYQGAIEAVMAVLVGAGIGYGVDRRWDTTPYGVISGVVVGFAAMVLRLLRMRSEFEPGPDDGPGVPPDGDGGRGPAEMPALSDVWQDDGREVARDADAPSGERRGRD
jgi:ATP synthase protein I